MTYAAITGWGEGLPPAVLSNHDLATFLDTTDDWITTRTGMKERRISHVSAIEMATIASSRALACAGLGAAAVVVQATEREEGVIGSVLGCDAGARQVLRVRGIGCAYAGQGVTFGDTVWDFDGQAIFKRAVKGMSDACERVMKQAGVTGD